VSTAFFKVLIPLLAMYSKEIYKQKYIQKILHIKKKKKRKEEKDSHKVYSNNKKAKKRREMQMALKYEAVALPPSLHDREAKGSQSECRFSTSASGSPVQPLGRKPLNPVGGQFGNSYPNFFFIFQC
jgi:hypothetical protein